MSFALRLSYAYLSVIAGGAENFAFHENAHYTKPIQVVTSDDFQHE